MEFVEWKEYEFEFDNSMSAQKDAYYTYIQKMYHTGWSW